MAAVVDLDAIRRARTVIDGVVTPTPVLSAGAISRWAGTSVLLKAENLQRTGAFKLRGAVNRMSTLTPEERSRGVVAASAGNHAQGVALAATALGVSSRVYMPVDAPLAKQVATADYGAEVVLAGETFDESYAAARADVAEGRVLVPPFDDEAIIAGQGTIGLELLEQAPAADVIVVPLGGGGLLSGIACAIKAQHPQVRVVGVEAAGCAPYVSSLEKGEIDPVHQTTTIADGIAVKRPGELTFALIRELVDDVVTVTDAEIGQAIVHLLERSKTVVEGAGAVGLAAILAGRVSGRKVVSVLSGGNIDTPLLMQVIRFGLTNQGRYLVLRTRLIDRPGQLMNLLKVIADAHVNILVVSHHRESVEVAVAETGIELILETRDEAHAEQIVALVRSQGYPVTRMR
jgi:threonine dehydratase